ncbi:UNVERIFIED_CONTAM: protein JINGUBANG [Sesamum radiatum]|uniref:Protein JINGUBANG n=1 Tax=Sesamum radiatum TaxID=300843 RepID=A0AAW2WI29_SESRA
MEFRGEENPWKFVDGERGDVNLPRGLSFEDNEGDSQPTSPRTSCASAASFPVWGMSPETPWARSPIHASSPRPLQYHCLASFHRSEGNIYSIAVTKDFLFAGSSSCRVHAWKLPDCIEMGYIKATTGEIQALLACGKLLFTTHGDCRIRAWEMPPTENSIPKKKMTLPQRRSFFSYPKKNKHQHKDCISCLAYNNREKLLFTGSWDQTVKVWKIPEKRCIDSFDAHEGCVSAIVINQDDGCVFTSSSDGTIKIWRRVSRESSHILMMILKFQPSPVNALALSQSPSASFLYSGSSDGLINFWEKETGSGRYNHGGFLQGHHFAVLCLVTIDDLLLSGSEDATIRIWKREDGKYSSHSSLVVIDGHHGPVKCLAAAMETNESVKGLLVYSASLDQTLKVWQVKVNPVHKTNWDRSEDDNSSQKLQSAK